MFILDNVLLTHETMVWVKINNQEVVFMKLDFTKVYDMVAWAIMFQAMKALGFHLIFITMTKIFL